MLAYAIDGALDAAKDQLSNMQKAFDGTNEIGAFAPLHGVLTITYHQIATHAGSKIDDDLLVLGAYPFHDFGIEINPP